MPKKMLIDATHPEETRVVVVDGTKVEEFDFESSSKRQLSGNIYLAKITRVEPSLQAAFVEYGGNRHGFLAFSEIHPDYYQIPKADRDALIAAQEAEHAEDEAEERRRSRSGQREPQPASTRTAPADGPVEVVAEPEVAADDAPAGDAEAVTAPVDADAGDVAPAPRKRARAPRRRKPKEEAAPVDAAVEAPATAADAPADTAEATPVDTAEATPADADREGDAETPDSPRAMAEGAGADAVDIVSEDYEPADADADGATPEAETASSHGGARRRGRGRRKRAGGAAAEGERPAQISAEADSDDQIESVGAAPVEEEARPRRAPRGRSYKIQEVIKVRQIMLVQVVKEERGNKGAALTTYLSLAGRYCVLMPNTARGGGVSRKITSVEDRRKLKEIASEFEVPKGMGIIIRTAGSQRTRAEIRRDYEYLLRQWEEVRELTLKSIAPTLIYEEGSLIKRSIRDLYTRDIDEVLVEGDEGYREAKDYMRMLMPSHAKNVKPYKETIPLFSRHQVENYLAAMFNPTVQLKSGGYIVIGVTEALVAIDVNSGRSTREGSIEETALKTNLEAADEVARQLRLRDLAGLIVIDFIDMDERRNNAAVEKRMKDRLASDRARIQIGRISGFGLMEMSRQRLRPGMIEASTAPCPHCHGTGLIRSNNSLALSILREVEEEGMRKRASEVKVVAPVTVANFIINDKRDHLLAIETRYGLRVFVEGDATLVSPEHRVERLKAASPTRIAPEPTAIRAETGFAGLDDPRDLVEDEDDIETDDVAGDAAPAQAARTSDRTPSRAPDAPARADADDPNGAKAAKRRRGKRGGRKRRREDDETEAPQRRADPLAIISDGDDVEPLTVTRTAFGEEVADAPQTAASDPDSAAVAEASPADIAPEGLGAADVSTAELPSGDATVADAPASKPKRRRTRKAAPAEAVDAAAAPETPAAPTTEAETAAPASPAVLTLAPEPAAPEPAAAVTAAVTAAASPDGVADDASAEAARDAAATPEPAVAVASAAPSEQPQPRKRGWWSLGSR